MIVRCAIFEGTVRDGEQERFDALIMEQLVPLIRKFPRIIEVQVNRNLWTEAGAPPIYLMLQLWFQTEKDLEVALASPERAASRNKAMEILPMFEGRVYHMNFLHMDRREPLQSKDQQGSTA